MESPASYEAGLSHFCIGCECSTVSREAPRQTLKLVTPGGDREARLCGLGKLGEGGEGSLRQSMQPATCNLPRRCPLP